MARTRYWQKLPVGLRVQIAFAVILTLGALIALPTVLSAGQVRQFAASHATVADTATPSAGSVVTSVSDFQTNQFAAAAFTDWD